jgi:hypothetical protein
MARHPGMLAFGFAMAMATDRRAEATLASGEVVSGRVVRRGAVPFTKEMEGGSTVWAEFEGGRRVWVNEVAGLVLKGEVPR